MCAGPSLDYLIRPLQERRGDRQAEGLGGLQVDDQLELGGLLDRQVSGIGALENLVDVDGRSLPRRVKTDAVRKKTTRRSPCSPGVCSRESVAHRQFRDLTPHAIHEAAADDLDGLRAILDHPGESAGKLASLSDLDGLNRHASTPSGGLGTEPEGSVARLIRIHEDGETREARPALRQ